MKSAKSIYLKDSDGETKRTVYFYPEETKQNILNILFNSFENVCGTLRYSIVEDEDGDILYEDGVRYY